MFVRLQKITFLLIVFCISFQVGYHFWPEFAYISGVRVDYLSPTFYLLDILILLFVALSVPIIVKQKITFTKDKLLKVLILLFSVSLIVNFFMSLSIPAHLWGLARFIEFSLFAFCVAQTFYKKDITTYIYILCISALISSALSIWQFFNQGSIGGVLYFIGERTFSLSTIGISSVNLGQQFLRPYGAFPHPNVLGFFLLAAIVFATPQIFLAKDRLQKIFLVSSIVIAELALLITFSRINIILSIIFFVWISVMKAGKKRRLYPLGVVGILAVLIVVSFPQIISHYFLLRGINFREELLVQSWKIFQSNSIFGIGLNNFFVYQLPLIKNVSPTNFQPPHNIFVLWLLQVGLVGFFLLPYVFYLALRSVLSKLHTAHYQLQSFNQSILFILLSIVVAGMFDHYFLTLEQGQIMLALILGLSFSSISFPKSLTERKSEGGE